MLHVFHIDLGETYTFDTDLVLNDIQTLKSSIEKQFEIPVQKQILILNGGELLDDDHLQVCMKIRNTGAGTEENPIYLLDKSHLESARACRIATTLTEIPSIQENLIDKWKSMSPTYETIVQRADTALNYFKYAQILVQSCHRLVREQQTQYQGWLAVMANVEDTLSSFLLNRRSFDRAYQSYLNERSTHIELLRSLPESIEILHKLKLPPELSSSFDNSMVLNSRSPTSSSSSSSTTASTMVYLSATTTNNSNSNNVSSNENDPSTVNQITLFQWITTQLGNMKINEIISMSEQVLSECDEQLLTAMNKNIDDLSKRISDNQLKRIDGIEERFANLQQMLTLVKNWQEEQKDCAEYLSSQRQRFSSSIGNQNDLMLIRDLSGIHIQNLFEVASRHKKLIDKEQIIRKSKQEIIDLLHYRFKNLMLLQRQLVDFDAQQSLYIHKLNRTRKMMTFLRQLDQAPSLYRKFLVESCRRKEHSLVFNQFSEKIYQEAKPIFHEEMSLRQKFIEEHEPHFLFNLLPGLKLLPTFFIREPLVQQDTNLISPNWNEIERLFDELPTIKAQTSASIDLSRLKKIIDFVEAESSSEKCSSKPSEGSTSSGRSTVVRSGSSCSSTDLDSNQDCQIEQHEQCHTKRERSTEDSTGRSKDEQSSKNVSHEDDDGFIKCSLENVDPSAEIGLPSNCSLRNRFDKDRQDRRKLVSQFAALKDFCRSVQTSQHELIVDFHQKISKLIGEMQTANSFMKQQIEQLKCDCSSQTQDNENLKIQLDLIEQSKQEWIFKCEQVQSAFDKFRQTSDIETSQIIKALQSDHEYELGKVRDEFRETIQRLNDERSNKEFSCQLSQEIQTETVDFVDKQSQFCSSDRDQSTQTEMKQLVDQSVQVLNDEVDLSQTQRTPKDQQIQFNSAIQRAVLNATNDLRKKIVDLEQQLNDKQKSVVKLKEHLKKFQDFYSFSSASTSNIELGESVLTSKANNRIIQMIPSESSFVLNSSTDDESSFRDQINRTNIVQRSQPISMPSTFMAQSMLTPGNAATSPKTEEPSSETISNILMDSCFKVSSSETSAAIELYTPFAASPPNSSTSVLSPSTPMPVSSLVTSPPNVSPISRSSNPVPPQACPIAFFTVNRLDYVIIYYNTSYQHFMIFTYLPTLHFVHSDCYELFNIQSRTNQSTLDQVRPSSNSISALSQTPNTTNDASMINHPLMFMNTSMINTTSTGTNGLNPSTIPMLGQVTDKEYCQAKKANNRFNVPLGTKFYRVRIKPWKPSMSTSAESNST